MTTFVELHALRSFPPSNLNRDDLGTPKTAVFGGVRRLRISSQCLKRTWRMSEQFRGCFVDEDLGVRTDRLPEMLLESLEKTLDEPARGGLVALLSSLGKKGGKPAAADDEGDEDQAVETAGEPSETADPAKARTPHLLFLSRQEIEAVTVFAGQKKEALAKLFAKKKVDSKALDKLRKELKEHLEQHTSRNAVDVGLFGRFVTSDELDTVEGALQVAHALGTQKVDIEYDYFTAVDDRGDEPGAGHLGETEYASSVLYLYACCDLAQLEHNLGARAAKGRIPDDESRKLARRSLPALVRSMAEATPKGKKTGTAPHTPADYVEVVVRRGAPLSFANAFIKPVEAREAGGDVMSASIARLVAHRDKLEAAYGRDKDVIARFVLCLPEAGGGKAVGAAVSSMDDLATRLKAKLEQVPGQAER